MKRGHRRASVFTHLLLVLLLVSVAANLLFWSGLRWSMGRTTEHTFWALREQAQNYLRYVARDLRTEPTPERIETLGRELGIGLRFQGPEGNMASDPALPALSELENERWHHNRGLVGTWRGRPYFVWRDNETSLVAFLPQQASPQLGPLVGLWFIGIMSVLLVGAWWAVARLLKPLRTLSAAVARVSSGQFEEPLSTHGSREFAALAESFNAMQTNIRNMIASREQLLSDASHELRSPTTRMRLTVEMLPESKARDRLRRDLRELEALTRGLLDSARLGSSQSSLEDETILLGALLDDFRAEVEHEGNALSLGPVPEAALRGDRLHTLQVLRNIMENALKYGDGKNHPPELGVVVGENHVELSLRDFGPGMDDEGLKNAFEPFWRADKARSKAVEGFGLGLGICKRILERMGGAISLESRPGEGTTVRLTFLRAPLPVPQESARGLP